MKKFAFLCFLGGAFALSQNAAGQFVSDATSIQTVAAAKKMKDNSWVTLEGNIVKQLREEQYLFRDSSGEIEIEIDKDKWKGRKVTPDLKIRISGEVEKEWFRSAEVDVKHIELLDSNINLQSGSVPQQ